MTTAACTSPEQIGDDAAECFEAKCDGFGGAEILGVLSDDVVENLSGVPFGFTVFGSKALFFGSSRRGLWITDGTPDGTTLIRDIGPLPAWDEAPHIAVAGTNAMWTFRGAVWVTDGTPTGTTIVKDFGAARDVYVYDVMAFGERVLFHGEGQLWVSDGTPEGTSVLSDVEPGVNHMAMGGKLYFGCSTPATGRELCVTDGTTAGTKVLADLRTGTGGIDPEFIGEIDGKLVFSAELSGDLGSRTVCSTDGTTAGTQPLTVSTAGATVGAVFGDALYFRCSGKVCRTDGTAAGTTQLVLAPGIAVTSNLVAANERVFFVAKTPATGEELWVTDGTAAGTTMLDIRPGEFSGATPWLLALGDRVVVGGSTANNEEELFISDGTVAGTVQVGDIQSGPTNSYGLTLPGAVVFGDKIIFAADDRTHGRQPWVTDGTDAGTRMLADIAPPSLDARSRDSKTFGTGSYFAIEDRDATLVWRSNGVKEGTTKLAALEKRVSPMFAAAGNSLYFAGDSSLWKTDGTPAGTEKVRDLPGSIEELTAVGNRLAFAGSTSTHSVGLWVSDGTAAGTLETGAINARRLGFASGRLWLTALGRGNQLFTSDGTVAGTTKVADINPTDDSEPGGFVGLGGKTVFSAIDGAGRELWITDGSVAGTTRISDIHPGAGSSQPRGMTAFKSRVLFWATTMSTAPVYELYQSDGTLAGTTKLKAVSRRFAYTEAGLPDNFTVWGQHAFFVATDDAGSELWRTDGTEAGTVRVADIYAGPQPSNPTNLVLAGPDGPLYFVAEEPAGGREPWKLATPTGTPSRLADVRPGPRSSKPSELQPRGDALLFIAEGDNGLTLFRFGPAPDVIAPTIECPPDIELETTDGNGAAVDFAAPTASDNDGDATIETSAATGDLFTVGTTTVTATATDRAGNTASCTFDITVTYMGIGGGGSGGETGGGDDDGLALDDQGGGCSTADHSGAPLSLGLLLLALMSPRRRPWAARAAFRMCRLITLPIWSVLLAACASAPTSSSARMVAAEPAVAPPAATKPRDPQADASAPTTTSSGDCASRVEKLAASIHAAVEPFAHPMPSNVELVKATRQQRLYMKPPHRPTFVIVSPSAITVDGTEIWTSGQPLGPVRRLVRMRIDDLSKARKEPHAALELTLAISRDARWDQVVTTIDGIVGAGSAHVRLAFETPRLLPPPPQASELNDRLAAAPAALRASEAERLFQPCPAAATLVAPDTSASEPARAYLELAKRLPAAVETCGCVPSPEDVGGWLWHAVWFGRTPGIRSLPIFANESRGNAGIPVRAPAEQSWELAAPLVLQTTGVGYKEKVRLQIATSPR